LITILVADEYTHENIDNDFTHRSVIPQLFLPRQLRVENASEHSYTNSITTSLITIARWTICHDPLLDTRDTHVRARFFTLRTRNVRDTHGLRFQTNAARDNMADAAARASVRAALRVSSTRKFDVMRETSDLPLHHVY